MLDVICLRQVEGEAVACVSGGTIKNILWGIGYVVAALGLVLVIVALAWDGKDDEVREKEGGA